MVQLTKIAPFKMIDNLYFVGTKEASSHLIDTNDGLILIDTGYIENAPLLRESIEALGFSLSDIKIILHSHGHRDHTDATALLLPYMPNAKTYLNFNDKRYIKGFTPDHDIKDGDVIKLGNTEIRCLHTPGHTEGTVSLFFDVKEGGMTYRAGMFGGAGTNQLKKDYLNTKFVPYLMRGAFLDSTARLKEEKVDVFIGNHTGQNDTLGKMALLGKVEKNPYIVPSEWCQFLTSLENRLYAIIEEESRTKFITYAHRGASEYCPENTFMSFYMGVHMGANGIETDIHRTKDGILVLFHDNTLERVTGEAGSVEDYTYDELLAFNVKKDSLTDKIPTLDDFLDHFAHRDLTFAIELKAGGNGIEEQLADTIFRYGIEKKTVVTSFNINYIRKIKEYAPKLKIGYLTSDVSDEVVKSLVEMTADEICPQACLVNRENVEKWHRIGFNVRAWGVWSNELMQNVYDCGADGMTVNFPDKLLSYIKEKSNI